ncbi:YkoF family thiamine/hydroxymethylpyrimidine-binding protein [Thalassobacillus devorans]|uniref:YkoF family thiamine/hydroxymethylpyrimidine-binding protein n=1 Tax=Thalassobacillus devorans TaxID=279813 RepID=UPI000A1CCBDD|nr:YkoF family thiamine/hydroxymethylpyrimidine-binding protein [Thalassobacillus devorans]
MENQVCNGTSRIVGCRFSIHPMTDDFVSVILGALEEVDTSKVWMKTADVSTCVRGRLPHVFDVTQAIFAQAAKTGHHVAFSGTYSVGCPGDTEGDVYMSEDDTKMNNQDDLDQYTACDFALYPLGSDSYMEMIMEQIEAAKQRGLEVESIHYATKLRGEAREIFATLENAFAVTQEHNSHVVMTASISANSPSHQKENDDE